jgi:hypothetical protein
MKGAWLVSMALVTGCSLAVHGPSGDPKASCTSSYALPVVDTIGTVALTALSLLGVFVARASPDDALGYAGIIVPAAGAVADGIIAVNGYSKVSACKSTPH